MLDPKALLEASASYLRQNPNEFVRLAKNAALLRFGLPLQAFRWLAAHKNSKKGPRDVEIVARPPGLALAASFDLMGTPLRISAVACVQSVNIDSERMLFELKLSDIELKVTDDSVDTPLAALLRSGALDLSKPGNLAAYMPRRPAVLVDAKDDRIVLDLMKHPKLLKDPRVRKLLALLTPLVVLQRIETQDEHLDLQFAAFPAGLAEAWQALRHQL